MSDSKKLNMLKPIFRNPDKIQVLPWREWIREELPAPKEGFVVEDLDLIVLQFGPLIGRKYSDDGKFMLIEIKYEKFDIDYAQRRLFELIHRLLRKADPDKHYYIGFYIITWSDKGDICINGKKISKEQLKQFLMGEIDIPSFF